MRMDGWENEREKGKRGGEGGEKRQGHAPGAVGEREPLEARVEESAQGGGEARQVLRDGGRGRGRGEGSVRRWRKAGTKRK